MIIEFYGRYKRQKTKEEILQERDELDLKKILGKDIELEDSSLVDDDDFVYKPISFDTSRNCIKSFNEVDAEHTFVKTYTMDGYIIKLPYDAFKRIFGFVNGNLQIPSFNDFLMVDVNLEQDVNESSKSVTYKI
jgi:hypothetical protein